MRKSEKRRENGWVSDDYQEAETDRDNNSSGNGDGGKIEVAEVAGECLSNDSHGEESKATEDGRACDSP